MIFILHSVNHVFLSSQKHPDYISFRCFKVGSILSMCYKMHVSQRVRWEWREAHGKCFSKFRREPLRPSHILVQVCVPSSRQEMGAPPGFPTGTCQPPCGSVSVCGECAHWPAARLSSTRLLSGPWGPATRGASLRGGTAVTLVTGTY